MKICIMRQRALPFLFLILFFTELSAQVTTSGITGTVRDNNGQGLSGATVSALNVPSGINYSTITARDGIFNLPNLPVGGPYRVTVSYVGLQSFIADSITLLLGEPYNLNATMATTAAALETVVVT